MAQLPAQVDRLGLKRIVLVCSNSIVTRTPLAERAQGLLDARVVCLFAQCREHSPEADIDALAAVLTAHAADGVVAVGGSSVFDTVKVATARNADAAGRHPVPQIAIPTTLSAGEFTPGAGYTATTGEKRLVRDMRVAPRLVVLDPEATRHTPDALWFGTAIKALDHAMEGVWSRTPHPYVDALALEAVRLFFAHLRRSADRDDLEARGACQIAAWMSIAGVGASGMRLSHFLGHQIGARMHIAHGITSAVLLPTVMRYLRSRTLEAQVRIAAAMGLDISASPAEQTAADAADALERLIADLGLPRTIAAAGGKLDDLEAVAEASERAAMQLGLTGDLPNGIDDIRAILKSAW